ncbi:hypothetical protein Bbelb_094000 [Branchiostoma belcheri]|nr:hypothetical protein Bbelb_094000 [Branchiostoma belcheri]
MINQNQTLYVYCALLSSKFDRDPQLIPEVSAKLVKPSRIQTLLALKNRVLSRDKLQQYTEEQRSLTLEGQEGHCQYPRLKVSASQLEELRILCARQARFLVSWSLRLDPAGGNAPCPSAVWRDDWKYLSLQTHRQAQNGEICGPAV